jgi:hypothetical protein
MKFLVVSCFIIIQLVNVPWVAKILFCVLDLVAAGLIAGSMPKRNIVFSS